jgi:hypothetical protein
MSEIKDLPKHKKMLGPDEISARFFKRYSWEDCEQDPLKYKSTHQFHELNSLIKEYGEYCYNQGIEVRVTEIENKFATIYKKAKVLTRMLYFVGISIAILLILLEGKKYFDINLIPGFDSNVDDLYNAIRAALVELFK